MNSGDIGREWAELAEDILKLSRNTLLINLRFLESALVRFVAANEPVTPELATDGHFLYYNPVHVCRQFKKAAAIPARDYLHVTLHCLFRHLFVGPKVNSGVWDLSCDIAVEGIISGLGLQSLHCEREEKQNLLLGKLREELPRLTAERLYRYFLDTELPPGECGRMRADFYADDHQIWHKHPEQSSVSGGANRSGADNTADMDDERAITDVEDESEQTPPDEDEAEGAPDDSAMAADEGQDGNSQAAGGNEDERRKNQPAPSREETEQLWKNISERVEVDLETFSSTWGENAGDMCQTLAEINREKCDYAAFLRRFAVLGENMEVNDDEFDYIFYAYGMRLYDNMPLVEPLEYKETKRVREFVIALDTSESVAGELVQKFVAKTWNILKQTENFFMKVNVHIIQCGARVEEDAKITCEDDFDAYMRRMVLRGFGGTDFRPVFEHVNGLIRRHEFLNFKGLIYFTDGYGTYPAMPPEYEAAFVFVDQGRDMPDVPVWAMRLVLSGEDIEFFCEC